MVPLPVTSPTLLVFLLILDGVGAQGGWSVYYNPESICALKGSTVTMGCSYIYPNGYTVQKSFWSKELLRPGYEPPDLLEDPEYRGRVHYLRDKNNNCRLRLRDVRETDQGKYYFRFITYTEGGKYQGPGGVALSVSGLQVEGPERVMEGDNITLTCRTSCRLTDRPFIWYRNGDSLSSRTEQLYLQRVSREDTGRYSCSVLDQNLHSPEVTLNVLLGPPKSISMFVTFSGEKLEGSSVTLTCSSDGNPPVQKYTWFKDGGSSPVGSGHSYSFTLDSETSGWYYCEARSKNGSQRSIAVPFAIQGEPSMVLYVVIGVGVGVGLCGVAAIPAVVFLLWRNNKKKRKVEEHNYQNVSPNVLENTYTALDPRSRSSNDVYHTLATSI